MDTFEDDITNEKDFMSKESIEKANSYAVRSIDENAFNFYDFLKEKYFLFVTSMRTKNIIQITNKSIFKIFQLYIDSKYGENMEDVLLNFITCIVVDNNMSFKDDFGTINHGENSVEGVEILDAPFVKLLEQTKNYKINMNKKDDSPIEDMKKKLLIYEEQKNKINIGSNSIKKICKFLNKTIFDISDYINVLVLYMNEDDMNLAMIQDKLLYKYEKSGENFYFLGTKKYDINIPEPPKNKKNKIYKLDDIFEEVMIKMDNIEDNISEYEENKNENDNIQNVKKNDGDDKVPKKYIDQKMKIAVIKYDDKDKSDDEDGLRLDRKCNCQKDLCSIICTIF